MFTNITIGRYIYKNSLIHKIHPIIKILIALFIITASLIFNYRKNLILILYAILLTFLTKIDIKQYLKNIYGLRYIIISILFINLLFNTPIFNTINTIEKLIIIFMVSSILMYTTNINEINYAINRLLQPLKKLSLDIDNISLTLTISIKFISVIFEQFDIIFKAFKSRGYKFNGSLKEKIYKIKNFISTLFYMILKKANDISDVLEIRNYDLNKINRKLAKKIKIGEYLILIMHFFILIFIIGRWNNALFNDFYIWWY